MDSGIVLLRFVVTINYLMYCMANPLSNIDDTQMDSGIVLLRFVVKINH